VKAINSSSYLTNSQIRKSDISEARLLDSEIKEWLTTRPQT